MLRLKIKPKGFDKGRVEVKKRMQRVLMLSMFKMEELAIQNAPVDRGDLRENIRVTPEILANKYVLISAAPHSQAMEEGTKPFYAPIKPLKAWAARKIGDENVAYAVRAKIAKEGITAQPFMRPAYHQVKDYYQYEIMKKEFSGV